jgi:hypothetical protein
LHFEGWACQGLGILGGLEPQWGAWFMGGSYPFLLLARFRPGLISHRAVEVSQGGDKGLGQFQLQGLG